MSIYQNMNECSKTIYPLLFTLFPVLINVLFNFIFLALLKMGVEGVAIPTLFVRILEFLLIMTFLLIKKPIFSPMKKFYYMTKTLF